MDTQAKKIDSDSDAALSNPPTNPKADADEIHAFLNSLKQHPGGPHICDMIIAFKDRSSRIIWNKTIDFPDMGKYGTFSRVFCAPGYTKTANTQLIFFKKPLGTTIGRKNNEKYDGEKEALRSFAMALIQRPGGSGKTMVIYDVDCVTKAEIEERGKPWKITTISLHRTFYEWCLHGSQKTKIGKIWYNQDVQYKGKGESQNRSLEWMERMTLLGDKVLTEMDWEAEGFSELNGH